jgi:hypothetical protein
MYIFFLNDRAVLLEKNKAVGFFRAHCSFTSATRAESNVTRKKMRRRKLLVPSRRQRLLAGKRKLNSK